MTRLELRRKWFKERYNSDAEFRAFVLEDARKRRRALYRTNPRYRAKVRTKSKNHYDQNREACLARQSEYSKRPKRIAIRRARKDQPVDIMRRAYSGAKSRGRPCNITVEDIERVWPKDNCCPIFRTPFVLGVPRHSAMPSIDCIIPAKGYVPGNIAIISWRANRIKNNGTLEEHEQIAAWLFEHALA